MPAGSQLFGGDFEEKQWTEQQAQLPAFPKTQDLIRIRMETMSGFEVSIDGSSIDIGQDGVVRYILFAKSARGTENVSFEGIRCDSRERKLYAVGRADRTWGQVRNPTWTSYANNPRSHHAELAREYFCPNFTKVLDADQAVKNLRRGGYARDPVQEN
jgi:hypothetical protein